MTRAKEKMILVMPTEEIEEEYHNDIVSNDLRMQYNSFLKMINSVKSKLSNYLVNIDLKEIDLSKEYNLVKKDNVFENIKEDNQKLSIKEIPIIKKEEVLSSHYSKSSNNLINKEIKEVMEFGTLIHYLLEIIDFKNYDLSTLKIDKFYIEKIEKFLNSDLLKDIENAKIYKEYEFIYKLNNEEKHGIIDLMIEYDNYIKIIDYKLKNIDDQNYEKQLLGYKEYIKNKTGKEVYLYLYSIMDSKYKEIKEY